MVLTHIHVHGCKRCVADLAACLAEAEAWLDGPTCVCCFVKSLAQDGVLSYRRSQTCAENAGLENDGLGFDWLQNDERESRTD